MYVKKILQAKVYDVATMTPISEATFLSQRLNNDVLLKREDLQPVFSFKIRGAYNKIVQLTEQQKKQGVIAASAGNHAQGVALAAKKLGIQAVIVMPTTTPEIKVRSCQARNAKVILYGDTFNEALDHALALVKKHGFVFIHPFDDPEIIAGQGTIGLEIFRQCSKPLDAIFVPVGGGGLIAGISAYIKYVNPQVRIIGVEYNESACLKEALKVGYPIEIPNVGIFADGIAVSKIGEETFKLIQKNVDEVITVDSDEICAAIKDIFDDTRSVCETAGATALAGLKKYVIQNKVEKKRLLALLSGANVNFDRLRYVSERAEIGEKKEAILAVTIPEKKGSFMSFCQCLGKRNITEFNYRYAQHGCAKIFVGVQVGHASLSIESLIDELEKKDYQVEDLTNNEIAKLHVRHMVGGRSLQELHERVYSVQFPERPRALLDFLTKLGDRWNISMFHYRNHGSAYGRVIVGIQSPDEDYQELSLFLKELTFYNIREETNNSAYTTFLKY